MNPQQYCHRILKKSGSNFAYSFYLLSPKRRKALEVLYAFCRVVDDCVDQQNAPHLARQKLQFWKEEVSFLLEKKPRHLISQALAAIVQEYQIPKKYLEEIVAGCEMDLTQKTYETFPEVETYCFRVASCVGLASLCIFGVPLLETTRQAAIALGKALQWTNILRDIVTDLRRERIYLPQEDLKHFGVSIADLSGEISENLNLMDLLYFEMERARKYFNEAWSLFPKTPPERRKLVAAILMGRFYESLLGKISKDPMVIFTKKASLTTSEKLKMAALVFLEAFLK